MKNLQDKLANINKAKENTAVAGTTKPIIQEAIIKKRVGRPTFKDDTTKYVRIFSDIPEPLKDRMTIALIQNFKGRFGTMSELINEAIEEFLNKHS